MDILELIGAPQSIYVRAVRLAFEEKGVGYALTAADPHSPEVLAIHPFGRIPVMRHGKLTLFESRAIITYVDRAFEGPSLTPTDPADVAIVEQWISALNTIILPIWVTYTRNSFFPQTADGSPDRAVIDPLLPQIERHIAVLSGAIATSGNLCGEGFSLADMSLMPVLAYLRDLPESCEMIRQAPPLADYFQRHRNRPSWIATAPPPLSELRRPSVG
jgi:glutathione S-transferase